MKTGDVFSAILEAPIAVGDWVVAPAGARVDGRIVEADKGGRLKGKANLSDRAHQPDDCRRAEDRDRDVADQL